MRTYVTTYPGNTTLGNFLRLSKKFYPAEVIVHTSKTTEAKSDQLRRLLRSLDDEYLILLEDDFYLIQTVDLSLLELVQEFCVAHDVDRFSLQSKNAHEFPDWDTTEHRIAGHVVYCTNSQVVIPFSLEASIWKRSFLLHFLQEGQSDSQIELGVSAQIRTEPYGIYALDHTIIHYRDAMRSGRPIIQLLDDPLRLSVDPSKLLALYPQGGGSGDLLL